MSEKIKPARMAVEPFARSPVSIIIPFYGQYDRVARLCRSIVTATRSNPYEIVVVDDASPDKGFLDQIKTAPQVRTVRSEKRLGHGGALRLGFESTNQPWVVFINSDCVIQQANWLLEMGQALLSLKDKNVRMVAARTDNPGSGAPPALKGDRNETADNTILESGCLPLYCVMSHRQLYSRIGGFLKSYPLGYEDEELAFRMRRHGYLQAVAGRAWVHHEGGVTLDYVYQTNPSKFAKAQEESRLMCLADMGRKS
jgi:GT2 family glycosyltransferase